MRSPTSGFVVDPAGVPVKYGAKLEEPGDGVAVPPAPPKAVIPPI